MGQSYSVTPSAPASAANFNQTIAGRDAYHTILENRTFEDLDKILACEPDDESSVEFVNNAMNQRGKGVDFVKKSLAAMYQAFPDLQTTIVKQASEGDCVFTEYRWSGTHKGQLGSAQPTEKAIINRPATEILEVKNGKICKISMINDGGFSILQELCVGEEEKPTPGSGAPPPMDAEDVEKLRESLCGRVVTPLAPDYNAQVMLATVGIESAPAVMIQCLGVADVVKAIAFCQDFERKNPTAPRSTVRGGGHSFAGVSTNVGGCVIDLRKMRSVVVDPGEQTVWVDGGATVKDLDREAFVYGLVMPTGQVSHTGIGGLASCGGGYGVLTHRLGLMVDNLLACELVFSDGRVMQCSKNNNPELFWAARGGARWLGVVTRFKFKLHKLTMPTCNAVLMWDSIHALKLFDVYRKLLEKDAFAFVAVASPPELGGVTVFLMHLMVFGDITKAKSVLDWISKEVGAPPMAEPSPMAERPWPEINGSVEFIAPWGAPVYVKGFEIDSAGETAKDFLEKFLKQRPLNAAMGFDWCCGEYCKCGDETNPGFMVKTAKERKPVFNGAIFVMFNPSDPNSKAEAKEFATRFMQDTKHLRTPVTRYYNFGEEESTFAARTSKETHDRFLKIKMEYDPLGFFGNHSTF
jgi:predicted ester cyclase